MNPWSFAGSNRTTYMFLNQPLGSDGKTRRFNFMALIFCILFQSETDSRQKLVT
jgi:hypothetical protein